MASRRRKKDDDAPLLERYAGVFRYSAEALKLVWTTSRTLTIVFGLLTLFQGLAPAATAYVGKLIVDQVILAAQTGLEADATLALWFVAAEAIIVTLQAAASRAMSVAQSLLRQQLGHKVNVIILEKALELDLTQFEDSETYDQLSQARRGASSRPLSLVNHTFSVLQSLITLVSAIAILWTFSGWIVPILVIAALPTFAAQMYFSGETFRLFQWRSPETREQRYLETVMAREDYAKEVKLLGLGERLLGRYKEIFDKVYAEDRNLTVRKNAWGFLLRLVTEGAFYGAYFWVVIETVARSITIGDMTMYLMLISRGQNSISNTLSSIGSMYEDNLYLSTLYELLETPVVGDRAGAKEGVDPGDGIRFEDVWFAYPGQDGHAIQGVSLHLEPGQKLALVGENGSGKTTLIKLLARLYEPSKGTIKLDGTDLQEWDLVALHKRIAVIFQDFVRYQFTVGENIGAGDVDRFEDEEGWKSAARRGMADEFIDEMEDGFHTRLGRWFKNGRELSGGQWQKVALSRAFMRDSADVLVFDEPTSAMDAEAEAQIFERIKAMTEDQVAILISHRFSTVRMADRIAVLQQGEVIEAGTHEDLMELDGKYARLFELQARGYR